MALIKRGGAVSVSGGGAFHLRDIDRQARETIERAREEAQRLIAQAVSESQRSIEERQVAAYREGFAHGVAEGREAGLREGREAGLAESRAAMERLVAEWTTALDVFRRQRQELIDGLSREALRLGLEIGRRVVHAAPRGDPELAAVQAAKALEVLGAPSEAEIVVHPEDRAAVERHLAPLAHRLASGEVRLRDDAGVGRGGCIVRAAGGEVDASVEPMIERVVELLLGPIPEEAMA